MKQDTELNIKLKIYRNSEIKNITGGIELECLNCGQGFEFMIDTEPRLLNDQIVDLFSEYVNDGYICENCKIGDND